MGKLAVGGQTNKKYDVPTLNTHFWRRIAGCTIVFQRNKYMKFAKQIFFVIGYQSMQCACRTWQVHWTTLKWIDLLTILWFYRRNTLLVCLNEFMFFRTLGMAYYCQPIAPVHKVTLWRASFISSFWEEFLQLHLIHGLFQSKNCWPKSLFTT